MMAQRFSRFGDLLIVDQTYGTNKYKLPLCTFIGNFAKKIIYMYNFFILGVDNDGKNEIFAFGILTSETEEQFTWFF